MKTKINLSVIIPTLNNVKGIKYLLNYFKDKPYKVIVVDNKKINLGFAGGVNKGSKNVVTKWMLILNDDIEFFDDVSINRLIELAEKNKLDAVSPILVNHNGEVENYGYRVLQYGKVELIKENYRLDPRLHGDDYSADGLTAACLLIKTSVFKKLQGFDESFFAYLEDVEYKMAIVKDTKVLHRHMTTSKTMGNFKARQDMINWWKLYFKNKDSFKFNFQFIVERLKNVSGFIKATFSSFFLI